MRPRDPVLLSVAQLSSPKKGEENFAGEEMQVDRDRERPDPEELQRRAAEASADAAGARPTTMGGAGPASAEPRRRITVKKDRRVQRRGARNRETAATVKNRQRDVSESLAQQ